MTERRGAVVLGASGAVGREMVKYLLQSKAFNRVTVLLRRQFDFGDDPVYAGMQQKIVDFDRIHDFQTEFNGSETVFCCLGTTRGKSGKDGFYKVDHDYVVNSARVAQQAGVKHFSLVSARGADANSFFFYLKVKGETERDVTAIGFDRFTIARPAVLQGAERSESRLGEKVAGIFMIPLNWVKPKTYVIKCSDVAKALVIDAVCESKEKVTILENQQLCDMAEQFAKHFNC